MKKAQLLVLGTVVLSLIVLVGVYTRPQINTSVEVYVYSTAESVITSDDGWGARRVTVVNHSNNDGTVKISVYNEKGSKIGSTNYVSPGTSSYWDVPFNAGRYTIRAEAVETEGYYLFKVKDGMPL